MARTAFGGILVVINWTSEGSERTKEHLRMVDCDMKYEKTGDIEEDGLIGFFRVLYACRHPSFERAKAVLHSCTFPFKRVVANRSCFIFDSA
ncbi:hypothetical protein J3E71DRAFT_337398 [Bipolaris maydis]|nr:hypothetical protein J3E71DRAFT_337398 [Bipolaris maydis]